jgi:hypothetical protein
MSLSSGLIAAVALTYMAILFAIAFYGDRRRTPLPPRMRAWVYSLSLAVYCTSLPSRRTSLLVSYVAAYEWCAQAPAEARLTKATTRPATLRITASP